MANNYVCLKSPDHKTDDKTDHETNHKTDDKVRELIEKDIPYKVNGLLSRFALLSMDRNTCTNLLYDGGAISTGVDVATNICGRLLLNFLEISSHEKVLIKYDNKNFKDTEFIISDLEINGQPCKSLDSVKINKNTGLKNHIVNFLTIANKTNAHLSIDNDFTANLDCIWPVAYFILDYLEKEIYSKTDFQLIEKIYTSNESCKEIAQEDFRKVKEHIIKDSPVSLFESIYNDQTGYSYEAISK